MKLTIDRSKWHRGRGGVMSYLLSHYDGKMCCLGFLALACGVPKDMIRGIRSPLGLANRSGSLPEPMQFLVNEARYSPTTGHTTAALFLVGTNDDCGITDEQREAALSTCFRANGIEPEFVN